MAATFSSSSSNSSSAFDILEQARQQFWMSNADLTEEQKQQRWLQAAAALPSNAYMAANPSTTHQTPRTMPCSTEMPQFSTPGLASVNQIQPSSTMVRVDSTHPLDANNMQRSASTFSDWQSPSQESNSEYSLYSQPCTLSQPVFDSIPESACTATNSMVEYSPDDYVSNFFDPSNSPSLPLSFSPNPHQLSVQLTPQWNSSSDGSTSPSTPSTALATPVTQSSNAMSRQGSYNPDFIDNVSMLRVQSDSSCTLPILSEDGPFPYAFDSVSKPISSDVDDSRFFHPTGFPASGDFLSSSAPSVSQSTQVLASSDNDQSCLAEDMRRSTSASSAESLVSDASAPSTCSRQSRRKREINAQAASRKIAPKSIELSDETESAPCNAQMARIRSEDGSSKTVGLLTKTPYVRPQHPKIMCQYCNERPEGFRGTHELDRHVARAHASTRKGYICIDYSPDKKFLANCKHCRNKKVYGAYYNAAAHLRRAHFHPRKRGRKGKNDEKRGGIGGGDHPAMDYLKQHWIKEVEVDNKATTAQTPESLSEDVPDFSSSSIAANPSQPDMVNPFTISADNTMAQRQPAQQSCYSGLGKDDTHAYPVDPALFPVQQQQQPMPSPIAQVSADPMVYMDFGMNMQSEPSMMYNPSYGAYGPDMVNDVHNFQFDACNGMPQ